MAFEGKKEAKKHLNVVAIERQKRKYKLSKEDWPARNYLPNNLSAATSYLEVRPVRGERC